MIRLCQIIAIAAGLAGCASSGATGGYARADGRATDSAQMRMALAQCQGEGAKEVGDYVTGEGAIPWAVGMATRGTKENAIVNACMARNGYLAQ